METSIENVQNINPDRKARRKIFLTEKGKEKERETLKKTLELWASVINKSDSLTDMVAHCDDQRKAAEDCQELSETGPGNQGDTGNTDCFAAGNEAAPYCEVPAP